MKTRNGFVSNSSSSSFVIITTEEKWAEAKQKLTDKVGKNIAEVIIDAYGKGEEKKVLGQKALIFCGVLSSEEFGSGTVYNMLKNGQITEEESEGLGYSAYDNLMVLDDILNNDGVSYFGDVLC